MRKRIKKILCLFLLANVTWIGNSFGDESFATGGSLVIKEDEIKSLNVRSLVELLNKMPGVSATESSVSLQGSSTTNVLVLLDGRPLNDPLSGLINMRGISVYSIEKIEIIKGAGAVLYGDNTSGGVVLITTRKAHAAYKSKVEASYGSFNTRKYDVDLGTQVKDSGLSLSGNYEHSDGYRKNDDSDVWGGKIGINSTLGRGVDLRFSLNYSWKEEGYAGRTDSPTPLARSEKEDRGATLLLKDGALNSRTYYTAFDDYFSDPGNNKENDLKSQVVGEDVQWKGNLPWDRGVLLGLNGEIHKVKATAIGKHDENQFSVYGSEEFGLRDWPINLKVGLRLNEHSKFGSSYNPEIGLNYKKGKWEADIQVNRSSNIPTFRQRYYESTFSKGNPDLRTERATNYKVSVSRGIGNSFSWDIVAFYSLVEDGIASLKSLDGIYRYENIGSSSRKGTEAGFDWRITEWLGIDASYIYLLAKDENTGLFLPHKPKHTAKADMRISKRDWSLIFQGKYVSDSFVDMANTEVLDGYFLADGKLTYQLEKVNLFFEIDNIFDRDYEFHPGYPGAGRAYTAGISYIF